MKWLPVYKPAPQRELAHMDRSDATCIIYALEAFAADGRGDVKTLRGALKGRYRPRMGKWRVFFNLDQPGNVVVTDVDNRGQAYWLLRIQPGVPEIRLQRPPAQA